jgi:hypothetical protein
LLRKILKGRYCDDMIHEECGRDHFYLNPDELREGSFCREAVVSLAADFNGGALDCNCDRQVTP